MVISVVGGSGFLGTRLCERLEKKQVEFTVVDKALSKTYPQRCKLADVRDVEALRANVPNGTTVLVNLAAEHKDNVRPLSLYEDVNVGGARNVCEVAAEKGVRTLVFTSSVACYGFAPPDTSENGALAPFNEYGRTKAAAEEVYREWQAEDATNRCLVIVRPTVIFGEKNRGNVYNLLRQVMTNRFVMVGNGRNVKSMAYVENTAAFLEYAMTFTPGVHLYNYVDKPDLSMNELVGLIRAKRASSVMDRLRIPYSAGHVLGYALDVVARLLHREFPISAIRVKKFCATTQFATSVADSGFVAPISIQEGLERTLQYDFLSGKEHGDDVFYSE